MIPFFGPFISWVPPVIVALALQPESLVPTVILMGIGWFFVMNVLQPRIMQGAVGIHPIVVLGSVLIGGRIAGHRRARSSASRSPPSCRRSSSSSSTARPATGPSPVGPRGACPNATGRPVRIPREPRPGTATDIDEAEPGPIPT